MWCGGGDFGEEERGAGAGKIFLHVSLRGRGRSGGRWGVGSRLPVLGSGMGHNLSRCGMVIRVCLQTILYLLSLLVSKIPVDEYVPILGISQGLGPCQY